MLRLYEECVKHLTIEHEQSEGIFAFCTMGPMQRQVKYTQLPIVRSISFLLQFFNAITVPGRSM